MRAGETGCRSIAVIISTSGGPIARAWSQLWSELLNKDNYLVLNICLVEPLENKSFL